jgi:signal transduction histidine kinase
VRASPLRYAIRLKDHGGDIRVESTAGEGAEFIVVLPLVQGIFEARGEEIDRGRVSP